MRVLIDFDGTLCRDPSNRSPTSPPPRGAIDFVQQMKAAGHVIIVFSCRANDSMPDGYRARHAQREVRDYLERYGITYDEILTNKPHADLVIDEHAIAFDGNWRLLTTDVRFLSGGKDASADTCGGDCSTAGTASCGGVVVDYDGNPRTAPYSVGAFESP